MKKYFYKITNSFMYTPIDMYIKKYFYKNTNSFLYLPLT